MRHAGSRTSPTAPVAGTGRGRPLDLGKRRAILDAAHRGFMEAGYQSTSMDAVAAEAGVSKLTIYNHFGSKGALFAAVIERKCHSMLGNFDESIGAMSAREMLNAIGKRFVRLVTDADAISAHNVIVQERERAPELGPLFYNSAVLNTSRRLAAFLRQLSERGEVRLHDFEQAARDILSLWRAQPAMHVELGVEPFSGTALDAHVERVTEIFLKAWR